jgi:hypothetical protein
MKTNKYSCSRKEDISACKSRVDNQNYISLKTKNSYHYSLIDYYDDYTYLDTSSFININLEHSILEY